MIAVNVECGDEDGVLNSLCRRIRHSNPPTHDTRYDSTACARTTPPAADLRTILALYTGFCLSGAVTQRLRVLS